MDKQAKVEYRPMEEKPPEDGIYLCRVLDRDGQEHYRVQVDKTTLLQGVYDAKICNKFKERLILAVGDISYSDPVSRPVCDYDKLLETLPKIKPQSEIELSPLWRSLGESLASGLMTGRVNR